MYLSISKPAVASCSVIELLLSAIKSKVTTTSDHKNNKNII